MEYKCDFCNKNLYFENYQSFGNHKRNCKHNPNLKNIIEKLKLPRIERREYQFKCNKCGSTYILKLKVTDYNKSKYRKTCSSKCANSRIWSEQDKINKSISNSNNPNIYSNRGVNSSDLIKNKISKSLISYHEKNPGVCIGKGLGRHLTDETKKKISDGVKGKTGGYRQNAIKNHRSGCYKGYWCDSSWELAYVIYNLEHDIKFERNTKKFNYEYEGQTKKFIPDFIIQDDTYVEIKGYHGEQSKNKIRDFKYNIILITGKDIDIYLNYVIQKYGKDFIKLYDK